MMKTNELILSTDPCQYPVQVPKIPRQAVVDELFNLVQNNHEVLLYGPAHWGKSYLVEHNVPEDQNFKSEYDSILYLNLFTLRIPESDILEREAVRWLINNPDEFDCYQEKNHQSSHKKNMLQHYLLHYFCGKKPLLIIDHSELLTDTNAIQVWVKKFRKFLLDNNIDTIWVDLCFSPEQSRISLWSGKIESALEPPRISESELKDWLSLYKMGHLAHLVHVATGGTLMLIRDFFVYAINKKTHNAALVNTFIEFQAKLYSRSCHYILQAMRKNPSISIEQWKAPTEPCLQEAFQLSGVYRKNNTGISIASKVHEDRLERLLKVENLLLAGATLELNEILHLFKQSENLHELTTELMTSHLLSRITNEQVFDDLKKFMHDLHSFQCEFFFQENNRLIWFSTKKNKPVLQLKHHLPPQFQEAIWSGAPKVMQQDKGSLQLFVPVVGTSGSVELIVSGLIPTKIQKMDSWRLDLYIRKIWHVFQSLHPVLMRTVDSYTLKLSQHQFRDQWHKLNEMVLREDKNDELAILRESKSTALIFLKRVELDSQINWVPRRIQVSTNKHLIDKELFIEKQNSAQLDIISQRKGVHGLVIETDKAFSLFPMIEQIFSDVKLFIKPIRIEKEKSKGEERQLALFLFAKKKQEKTEIISSAEQQYLSILAHRLARNEYSKQLWRHQYQGEMALLNDISFAMAKALLNPIEAQESILQALKIYFNVEAISIYDVVELRNKQKEVHYRRGLGYSPGHEDVTYSFCEGKTWLIAGEHNVIVWWKKSETETADFFLDKDGTLLPYTMSISGNNRCAEFLPSLEVKVFLGAPILFHDPESGQEVAIGILKMANRMGDQQQIFSDREADSAGRIARLIAPFIYMLQNPDRYGLERRIKLMRSMFYAIGHEFRNPLSKIGCCTETALLVMNEDDYLYLELSKIYEQKQRLTLAIDAIEQLANQEPGQPTAVDLSKAIKQAWKNIRSLSGADKIIFEFEPPTNPVFVKIDVSHFIHALENIMKNAVEILLQVTLPEITVSLSIEKGGLNRVVITDNGPGLSEKDPNWIFEPFATSHEQKFINGIKPRGIGLALTRTALENAGGKIECKNNSKGGASFLLYIPSC